MLLSFKLYPPRQYQDWLSNTEFTNNIYLSQTAGTSENANNYEDHLRRLSSW